MGSSETNVSHLVGGRWGGKLLPAQPRERCGDPETTAQLALIGASLDCRRPLGHDGAATAWEDAMV
jgi:hypothetical protein